MRNSNSQWAIVTIVISLLAICLSGLTIAKLIINNNHNAELVWAEKKETAAQQLPTPRYTVDSLRIKDFGLNVHFFQQTGNNFAEKLVIFLENHTNLEVSAIAGEVIRQNRGGANRPDLDYGETIGYFVTFREKK